MLVAVAGLVVEPGAHPPQVDAPGQRVGLAGIKFDGGGESHGVEVIVENGDLARCDGTDGQGGSSSCSRFIFFALFCQDKMSERCINTSSSSAYQ